MPKIGTITTAGTTDVARRAMPVSTTVRQHRTTMRTADLFSFVVERHNIYKRRLQGFSKPWTADPILQQYRFCNVYRELDIVTVWIAENWRMPHCGDPDLWFAMVVARLVNWPDSLAEIGYPVPWRPERFVEALEGRKRRGAKVFTGAYMVRAEPRFNGSKAEYLAGHVLTPMWQERERLRRIATGTLADAHRMLMNCRDMGSFMAAQVIADLKYVEPLRNASDWWSWAASGPGSRRGLNRMLSRAVDASWSEDNWLRSLQALHAEISPLLLASRMRRMHAQDLQNCLCEFDKYERVRLGEGKPRSRYPGLPGKRN